MRSPRHTLNVLLLLTYLGSFLGTLTMLNSWSLLLESSEFLMPCSQSRLTVVIRPWVELTLNSLQVPEMSLNPRLNLLDMMV